MKLYNLSASATSPCIVVKFKTCTIMLDCCLDFKSVLNFLPLFPGNRPKYFRNDEKSSNIEDPTKFRLNFEIKEIYGRSFVDSSPEFNPPETDLLNLSEVDLILISNFYNITALPYITEYCGFKGQVYATEPTKEFGRLLLEELITFCRSVPKDRHASLWKNPKFKKTIRNPVCRDQRSTSWKQIFTMADLNNSLKKIRVMTYAEEKSIFGALQISAHSSGFAIGSCNWVIKSDFEKIVYMSGSSKLPSHPDTLDDKCLTGCDLMVFYGLTEVPLCDPSRIISDFSNCIIKTAKQGGNTLVPCLPSGIIFDLLEHLLNVIDIIENRDFTIYFVSPSAKGSLAFSQIYSEWLHREKQSKAFIPEQPFTHEELKSSGKLKIFSSIRDGMSGNFKQPCVVFTGHPSLRFGDVVHFMNLWSSSHSNSIIFIDSNFSHVEALAPFQPVAAKTYFFPIDTRLEHKDASVIIDKISPKKLVVPHNYILPPSTHPHRTDLRLTTKCAPTVLELNSVMKVDLKRKFEKVSLQPDLAASLFPQSISSTSSTLITPISAMMCNKDNRITLNSIHKSSKKQRKKHDVTHRPLSMGKMNFENLVVDLKQEGFSEAILSSNKSIKINNAVIEDSDRETLVTFSGNCSFEFRSKLLGILLRNLKIKDV